MNTVHRRFRLRQIRQPVFVQCSRLRVECSGSTRLADELVVIAHSHHLDGDASTSLRSPFSYVMITALPGQTNTVTFTLGFHHPTTRSSISAYLCCSNHIFLVDLEGISSFREPS